jgi:hypothetical protein
MDTETLHCCLSVVSERTCIKNVFVVSRDHVNTVDFCNLPIIVCVNTDDSSLPGKHWVVFYVYQNEGCCVADYFDSYGLPMTAYNINFPYKIVHANNKSVQTSDSNVCGLHVIFYCFKRSRGISTKQILSLYSNDNRANDRYVRVFYHRIKLIKKASNYSLATMNQTCCARLSSKF